MPDCITQCENWFMTNMPVPPGWWAIGFLSRLLKAVVQFAFSHHPRVLSTNCCCFGITSQHMLCLALPNTSIWCCCVKCLNTINFKSPSAVGIMPLTFWKQIRMQFCCFFLEVYPTLFDILDLRLPHPRQEQDASLWVVPLVVRDMQVGGPHLLVHHALASWWSAGSTCVASGKALVV